MALGIRNERHDVKQARRAARHAHVRMYTISGRRGMSDERTSKTCNREKGTQNSKIRRRTKGIRGVGFPSSRTVKLQRVSTLAATKVHHTAVPTI